MPVKNAAVSESRLPSGEVQLAGRQPLRPFMAALLRRIGGAPEQGVERKVQLDTLGTQVWDLVDGHRTVDEMARAFAADHRIHPREAEAAVTRFLRELGKRGLIGLR